jgi:hypothetical protein
MNLNSPIGTAADPNADTAIHTRAMLVWLQIGTWSARKYDKQATAKVTADHHAAADSARVNKSLLPGDATAYKALTSLAGSIRAEHYTNTLAWADEGWRLLPVANFQNYTAWYRGQKTAYAAALADFCQEYPSLRAGAPARLNGLYRASDYPETIDMASRFTLDVQFSPVPAAGDIRLDLAADQRAIVEASITGRVEQATAIAMRDAWTRLHDVVSHIAERLSDPTAVFRDSLIENARAAVDSLKRLNVTNDPDLERMRARVEAELTKTAPDVLRSAPMFRQDTAERAKDIMTSMAGFYGAPTVGA